MNFLGSSARIKQNTLCVSVLCCKLSKIITKKQRGEPVSWAVAVLCYKSLSFAHSDLAGHFAIESSINFPLFVHGDILKLSLLIGQKNGDNRFIAEDTLNASSDSTLDLYLCRCYSTL